MKVTMQRQCDGTHPDLGDPNETCVERVEIALDLADRAGDTAWGEAFAAAMLALGWRRIGELGHIDADRGEMCIVTPESVAIVPWAKTWVVCKAHAQGTVCAFCLEMACECEDGPFLDVVVT